MRFLVDAQLPPALAQWLGEHGCAATPVRDVGLRESDDGSIRNFAIAGDWVLLTKDEDLVEGRRDAQLAAWMRAVQSDFSPAQTTYRRDVCERSQNGLKRNGTFRARRSLPTFGQSLDGLARSMNVRLEKMTAALLALLAISGINGRGQDVRVAPAIQAVQEDENTIRVVVPGQFETTFTKRKGLGGVWFDLKHDAHRKHDLAPVLDENGFLWVKNGPPGADGSWYANPPREMILLESGPTRVRVRLSGVHQRYGQTKPEAAWKELGFEQLFTVSLHA